MFQQETLYNNNDFFEDGEACFRIPTGLVACCDDDDDDDD
jgi:hypothetical protein